VPFRLAQKILQIIFVSQLLHYLKAKVNFKNMLCKVHGLQIHCKIPVKFSELRRYAFLVGKHILIYFLTV
jgi:hypothetical protein